MKNINKIKLKKRVQPSAEQYFEEIMDGNKTSLSRAITLLESSKTENHELAEKIVEFCLPKAGNSIRIGITGVPGVGKSTFIEAFGTYLIETHNLKVAVLAIDPSSQKTKGSILGDKTRMNKLSVNDHAFIRPSPSSGSLGGVAKATRESIILCEAAGFDVILIETVGVGQSETEVASMTDFFLLLMLAGAGDELQGIKRGIMEMADCIAINKSDTEDSNRVKMAQQEYKNALHLFPANENSWIPKVVSSSALQGIGIPEIWKIIGEHKELCTLNGWFDLNRKKQAKFWLQESINQSIVDLFKSDEATRNQYQQIEESVINGELSPHKAAKQLISILKN